ncbi:MAG TPA: 30S ribosomal protein S1 [Nitrospinota bacterium]|jgi:small subunit ribosomal protein S1|nr:30S ribosomal protein S1 [Nitrospinota bacterium]
MAKSKRTLTGENNKDAVVTAVEEENDLDEEYSPEKRAELQSFYESSMKNYKEGEIIAGIIVSITEDSFLVDIGFKSEGFVNRNEFPGKGAELNVGDEVQVFLDKTEDNDGQVVLSKEKANRIKMWNKVEHVFESGELVEGTVISKAKGGLTVDIGLKAFLPGSQIDLKPIRDMDRIIGQKFRMKVIKMDKKRNNIVLSRRVILEEQRNIEKKDTLATIEEGKTVEGVVKNITDYGVFVDLGGIDGLLHITDMSWGRVNHPSELFSLGDKIKVIILKYDKEKERVSLGHKQTTEDPWISISEKYSVETKIRGKVVCITDYGAFIEIEQGIEGLVHISEMSWSRHIRHPSKLVAIGDTVEAVILSLDKDKKRISLGMKQIEPNPWDNIEEKYPDGAVVEGRVKNVTDFGAFVELEEGIDGLIHISDMHWTKKINHPSEVVKKRETVKTVVLKVDRDAQRLSLGIKQLTPDPWEKLAEKYTIGTDVKCKVCKATNYGAFVELEEDVEGLIHISQLTTKKITNVESFMPVGKEVTARVIKIDAPDRKIALSIKAFEQNLDASQIEESQELNEMETSFAESKEESRQSEDKSTGEEKKTNKNEKK